MPIFGKTKKESFSPPQPAKEGVATNAEAYNIEYDLGYFVNGRRDVEHQATKEQWEPILEAIQNNTGVKFSNPANNLYLPTFDDKNASVMNPYPAYDPNLPQASLQAPDDWYNRQELYDISSNEIFDYIKDNQDILGSVAELKNLNGTIIFDRVKEKVLERLLASDDLNKKERDWVNYIAGFGGAVVANFTDLTNIVASVGTFALTAKRGGGVSIARGVTINALANAGAGAVQQEEVMDWYASLDLPYSIEDFYYNVAASAAAGAVLDLGIRGASKVPSLTASQWRKGKAAIDKVNAKKSGLEYEDDLTTKAAETKAKIEDDFEAQSPYSKEADPSGQKNIDDQNQAIQAVVNEDFNALPTTPNSQLKSTLTDQEKSLKNEIARKYLPRIKEAREKLRPLEEEELAKVSGDQAATYQLMDKQEVRRQKTFQKINDEGMAEFEASRVKKTLPKENALGVTSADATYIDPDTIFVDAKSFQFKGGGDEFGVTERLEGVTEWDPVKSNVAILYETKEGKLFVVDGHQRIGLAKRLKALGQKDIKILSYIRKESDGFTMKEVRAEAAAKNIAEGTGTLADVARVFRDDPRIVLNMPPRSKLVQMAKGLQNLSNEVYMAAEKGNITKLEYASIIGQYIDNPANQMAVLKLLQQTKPQNMTQAESIVAQAKSIGFEESVQGGLFGDEVVADNAFLSRARILDSTLKYLRGQKSVFKTLVDDASVIEQYGNSLNKLTNTQKDRIYGEAIETIKQNANNVGDIADNLTTIAKEFEAAGSKNIGEYAKRFATNIEQGTKSGNFKRIKTSGRGGNYRDATERITNESVGKEYSDPNLRAKYSNPVEPTLIEKELFDLEAQVEQLAKDSMSEGEDIRLQYDNSDTGESKTLTIKGIREENIREQKIIDELKDC
jgi:hypothetical protein